jgi:hypothetical protein
MNLADFGIYLNFEMCSYRQKENREFVCFHFHSSCRPWNSICRYLVLNFNNVSIIMVHMKVQNKYEVEIMNVDGKKEAYRYIGWG